MGYGLQVHYFILLRISDSLWCMHRHYSEEYMAGLMRRFLGDLQNDSPEMDRSLLRNIYAGSSYRG
jgi:hypothetical protein